MTAYRIPDPEAVMSRGVFVSCTRCGDHPTHLYVYVRNAAGSMVEVCFPCEAELKQEAAKGVPDVVQHPKVLRWSWKR